MPEVVLAHQVDFATWRSASRYFVHLGTEPEALHWTVASIGPEQQYGAGTAQYPATAPVMNLSRRFALALGQALQLRDPERFAHLYRIMYRLAHDGLELTDLHDPDLVWLRQSVAAVRATTLRFREAFSAFSAQQQAFGILQSAPEHYILEANARYCTQRNVRPWQVVTPYRRMEWTGDTLRFAAGTDVVRDEAAVQWQVDGTGIWRGYALSVVPPQRKDVDTAPNLALLGAEAMDCRACALWEPASRTVFGEGPQNAALMLVGEQPGDQEDLQGRPFVGPAGQMLDKALQDAGLQRHQVYVTNAVKHFHFIWKGSRRLHQKPEAEHVAACRVWLDAERRLVRPALLVMLGVTAAQSVLKKPVTISATRSRLFHLEGETQGLVTVHPSYLLRLPDEASRQREYARFVEDLRLAANYIGQADPCATEE
ncbi:UdgX family uracil-DNA binding protein [Acetobacter okinawensis]|uniref:UdgX family uracil-DNA binding protein n=1 Tax=Acetobacter okinawensis TaxID=1076594 RepID=UPI00209D89C3|nr:UdgX family uracil-DNA binding protein [Acetobacter okinawensis]MCP1213069.1 UdgX family uracil-DNA binding protein [Acetobacter okinawensis]